MKAQRRDRAVVGGDRSEESPVGQAPNLDDPIGPAEDELPTTATEEGNGLDR